MSWLEALYLVIAAAVFVLIFREGEDEPFAVRVFGAFVVGALWLPLLVLMLIFVAHDWIGDRIKGLCK